MPPNMLDLLMGLDKKKILGVLIIIAIALVMVFARVVYLAAHHYNEGEGYYAASNMKLAMREYDTSMHFYFPFSPYMEKSAERLWAIGQQFEKEGKPDWALIAYGDIRSSFYADRSFFTPGRAWISRCGGKLATVESQMLVADGSIKPEARQAEYQKLMAVFRKDLAPSVFWSILAEIGFLGWVITAFVTAFKGFTKEGRLKGRPALYGAVTFVFFLAVWAVGLLKA